MRLISLILGDDLDIIYTVKEDLIFKEFIKYGVSFVEQVHRDENTFEENKDIVNGDTVQVDEIDEVLVDIGVPRRIQT